MQVLLRATGIRTYVVIYLGASHFTAAHSSFDLSSCLSLVARNQRNSDASQPQLYSYLRRSLLFPSAKLQQQKQEQKPARQRRDYLRPVGSNRVSSRAFPATRTASIDHFSSATAAPAHSSHTYLLLYWNYFSGANYFSAGCGLRSGRGECLASAQSGAPHFLLLPNPAAVLLQESVLFCSVRPEDFRITSCKFYFNILLFRLN